MKKFNQARVNGGSNYDSKALHEKLAHPPPRGNGRRPATEVRVKQRKRRLLVGARARNTVKLREHPKASCNRGPPKGRVQHQGNDLGDGKIAEDATMDNPQPSPKSRGRPFQRLWAPRSTGYGCSSTTRCQWVQREDCTGLPGPSRGGPALVNGLKI